MKEKILEKCRLGNRIEVFWLNVKYVHIFKEKKNCHNDDKGCQTFHTIPYFLLNPQRLICVLLYFGVCLFRHADNTLYLINFYNILDITLFHIFENNIETHATIIQEYFFVIFLIEKKILRNIFVVFFLFQRFLNT